MMRKYLNSTLRSLIIIAIGWSILSFRNVYVGLWDFEQAYIYSIIVGSLLAIIWCSIYSLGRE